MNKILRTGMIAVAVSTPIWLGLTIYYAIKEQTITWPVLPFIAGLICVYNLLKKKEDEEPTEPEPEGIVFDEEEEQPAVMEQQEEQPEISEEKPREKAEA